MIATRAGWAWILAALLIACRNPVETCEDDHHFGYFNSCCTKDEQCVASYDARYPYCLYADRPGGGVCSECRDQADCLDGSTCFDGGLRGGRQECYVH